MKNYWSPPEPGDSRSPCPALNAMANCESLPRNGKDITFPAMICALRDAYHLTWPLAIFLVVGGYLLIGKWWKLDLEDLALHNGVEHDASLVHHDAPRVRGRCYAPIDVDVKMVDDYMADSADGSIMTAIDVARARVRREAESAQEQGEIDGVHQEIARGEMAVALAVFGAGKGIPLEYLRYWMHQEGFPEGWRRSGKRAGLLEVVRISKQIREAVAEIRAKRVE